MNRLTRLFAVPATVLSLALALLVQPPAATAEVDDILPSGQVGAPAPAQSVPWMVSVWDFAEHDGVVYVGGQFTTVRRWAGDQWTSQPHLAAFDALTGRPIPGFAPQVNGAVFALEMSSDGSQLFVGGEFSQVNGAARRGLVALDPTTGATVESFSTTVDGTRQPAVMDLERVGRQLYVAGSFSKVTNRIQGQVTRWRVARLFEGSGNVDGFRPAALNGRVYAIEPSPDGTRVYLGGAFTTVDDDPNARYFAAVSSAGSGALLPSFRHGVDRTNLPATGQPAIVFGIAATTDRVWIGTESHFLQMLDARTGERHRAYVSTWYDNTNRGGDFQELLVVGNRLYAGGHAYGMMVDLDDDDRCIGKGFLACRDSFPQAEWIDIRGTWIQAFDAATGAHDPSFRPRTAGRSGVWALHWSANNRALWFGGDITHNGFDAARGLGRLADSAVQPVPGPVTVRTTRQTRERIVLNWTAGSGEVAAATYEIERDGQFLATDDDRWYTDLGRSPGTAHTYRIRPVTANGVVGPWSDPLVVSTLS